MYKGEVMPICPSGCFSSEIAQWIKMKFGIARPTLKVIRQI
jgi:hypothetical protein